MNPLRAGRPEKIRIAEEGTIQIRLSAFPLGGRIVAETRNDTMFPNGRSRIVVPPFLVGPDGILTLTVASPADQDYVEIAVNVYTPLGDLVVQAGFQVQKDPDQDVMFGHNKHGGLVTAPPEEPTQPPSPSSGIPLHFTIDEGYEAGMATIWLYQPDATPVILARGDPMKRPLAGEVSADRTVMWVTDQAGAILELAVPTDNIVRRLFPYSNGRKGGY